ncbi:MAG: histidine kinase dimerization/phospho-acceptor domain-containing protein [Acidimicrobiia bacterium]|nr:histidine kinase dimerization/phospho-acceptor domain-containing protein [Acidimicrobiia bacterium]
MPNRYHLQRGLIALSIVAAALGVLAAILGSGNAVIIPANAVAILAAAGAWIARPGDDSHSALIAEVSHELRTPLTGILGTLELLTESTVPLEGSEVDELLVAAHGDANHLLHVVGNLHARSRLDRAILDPEVAAVDLRSIVKKALGRSPRVARRCYLSPGDEAVVRGDAQLIMQIVTNLIQNIERYAPDGEVRIGFARHGDQLETTFTDSGPGVPAYRAELIFTDGGSSQGLGLGLSLSRELARAMDGELRLENAGAPRATFKLVLPASSELVQTIEIQDVVPGDRSRAYSPRARLLVDLAEALAEQTLDSVVGGIHKLYAELLGATGGVLLVAQADGTFVSAGPYAKSKSVAADSASELAAVISNAEPMRIEDISHLEWASERTLGGQSAMLLPVHDGDRVIAVLAVGWKGVDSLPAGTAVSVTTALADLTAPAVVRAALSEDVVFERRLRSSVMDELPIAVSIFAGDPPRVVDMNRKEREMLRLRQGEVRPRELDASQDLFDVRFADGTPLTVDNAPVTTAIRTGKATGPFILIVRRADGTHMHTRTYCAPFFDKDGAVAGAVVTSEPLDVALAPEADE